MNPFKFQTVPSLVVEFGAARRIGAILRERHTQTRLCLVTDGFLHLVRSVQDSGFLQAARDVQLVDLAAVSLVRQYAFFKNLVERADDFRQLGADIHIKQLEDVRPARQS